MEYTLSRKSTYKSGDLNRLHAIMLVSSWSRILLQKLKISKKDKLFDQDNWIICFLFEINNKDLYFEATSKEQKAEHKRFDISLFWTIVKKHQWSLFVVIKKRICRGNMRKECCTAIGESLVCQIILGTIFVVPWMFKSRFITSMNFQLKKQIIIWSLKPKYRLYMSSNDKIII